VKVNGQFIKSTAFSRFGNTQYSIASIQLPFGSHMIECSAPFGLYSYGLGKAHTSDAYDAYGAMGGQSFIDYEPIPDTIPPQAELIVINRKKSVMVSDDGKDDTGLRDIVVVKQTNLNLSIPKFTMGAPSAILDAQPINISAAGSCIFRAKDVAGNEASYTLCYVFDNTINEFVYVINKGEDADCATADS
jgi:hypothetical protein